MTTITRGLLAVAILFTVGITHPVPARAQLDDDYSVTGIADFPYAIATQGDVDGDEYPDVVIGVPEDSSADEEAGAVYLFYGKNIDETLALDTARADHKLFGDYDYHHAGSWVEFIADEDGDGLDEIEISFGEDTLTQILASTELRAIRTASPRTAVVSVSVGVAENIGCGLRRGGGGNNVWATVAGLCLLGIVALRRRTNEFIPIH